MKAKGTHPLNHPNAPSLEEYSSTLRGKYAFHCADCPEVFIEVDDWVVHAIVFHQGTPTPGFWPLKVADKSQEA